MMKRNDGDDEKVSKVEIQFDSLGTSPEDMKIGNFYYTNDGILVLVADDYEAVVISSPKGTYGTGDIIGIGEEELLSFVSEIKMFVKIEI